MYRTPPPSLRKMVETRGAEKERLLQEQAVKEGPSGQTDVSVKPEGMKTGGSRGSCGSRGSGGSEGSGCHKSVKASVRSSRTFKARKKQLQLEASEAVAKIQREIIEKKLAADIAALEEECSQKLSASASSVTASHRVEQWLEHSQREVEEPFCAGAPSTGQHHVGEENHRNAVVAMPGTTPPSDFRLLAQAIKDIAVSASSNAPNAQMLSRLCTPRELPIFAGEPMEWLNFKHAYEESTEVCNFTPKENMWRLRKCLRGPARDSVTALLVSSATPEDVMSTLELQFGQPDVILPRIIYEIKKMHPVSPDYHKDIVLFSVKIKNYVAAVLALGQEEYLRGMSITSVVLRKLPPVLISKWTDYGYTRIEESAKSRLEILSDFLSEEAIKITKTSVILSAVRSDYKRKPGDNSYHQPVLMCSESEVNDPSVRNKCKFCKRSIHALAECGLFKRAMRKDRWRYVRSNNLCFKCLGDRHKDQSACTAVNCDVEACGRPHHRLLHWVKPEAARKTPAEPLNKSQRPDTDAAATPRADAGSDDVLVTHAVQSVEKKCSEVSVLNIPEKVKNPNASKIVLKIVPVTIHGPKQSVHTHALLDDGATVSLIAADIADKAGLHGESVTMRASSAWDSELVCKTELINLDISNSAGNKFRLRVRKLKELNLPVQATAFKYYNEFKDLYNINSCESNVKPQMLIGQDNYDLIAPIVCKKIEPSGPFITQTRLGWCVHGALYHPSKQQSRARCLSDNASADSQLLTVSACTQHRPPIGAPTSLDSVVTLDQNKEDLHELVRRSFSLDSIGICNNPRQNSEEARAVNILSESAELIDGQWTVKLPWKSDDFVMPESYSVALKRLKSVERKMLSDPGYESRYRERIKHLFDNNFARRLTESECRDTSNSRIWYLPHFAVDNPNKKKLRLVFDAATKCNNLSLNDFLLQGPDLLNSLYGIMFRFRENPIGIIGDIKDMFLRIKIHSSDQDALRFLWKEQGSEVVQKCAMTSLIFGANCSPFVAQFINQTKNASRFSDQMPEAVSAIKNNQYMDDYIDSVSDEKIARKMVKEISFIHEQGGFRMCNWLSNVPNVLSDIPKDNLNDLAIKFNFEKQSERALGILWFPCSDMLALDLSFKRIPEDILLLKQVPTKREMLRIVMSIFDIHGYLGPFTIKGKILMRETWKSNIKWDDKLNDDLFNLFRKWIVQAQEINNIRIPRWYFSSDISSDSLASLELHLFCDASPSAYAAVAYWRRESSNGHVTVSFIASKCKVTPLKPVSVPRLELQGAVLACKLANSIKKEHRLKPNSVYYWSDSTTVLHWIKNNCRTYKVFVANRLGEIDELSKADEWHYVPTDLNVADLGTKDNDYVLSSNSTWFSGPSFLHQSRACWPRQPEIKIISDDKILEKIHVCDNNNKVICDLPVPDPSRFSRWLRLLRATATVLLFIEKCRKKPITNINAELMHRAEILLLTHSQLQSFKSEINLLKENKEIKLESRLRALTPILDENNLLRVGSRIVNAKDIDQDTKYPIILDGKNHTARLIVMHYHVNAAHSCNEMVINELRQKYWLVMLRPTVRTVAKQCLICRFRKSMPNPPRLGDLPSCRLTHHQRPFTMCGVDLFGPIEIVVGRQRVRRYGVLFTCLTVRAVHLELVPSLTTDSMIMALRRMAARRGWPHTVFSDNGTNLRGADTELKKAYKEVVDNQQLLASEALNKGVQWQFIPPASPHMGGAWERLIRSVKTALKVVLKERALKEETLSTFLCEVENMINSRPLTHVSVDPRDMESLTPNHFLLGSSSNLPQPGKFDDKDLFLRKQWRIAQRLADLFWSRWLKEVLPTLIPRTKWNREGAQLKVGDLVVVVDPNSPRNVWPKGVIQKVYPGADGRVRILDIKTKSGVMKRPASRVALLLSFECRNNDDTKGENVGDDNMTAHSATSLP